jgi:hypothetical protein
MKLNYYTYIFYYKIKKYTAMLLKFLEVLFTLIIANYNFELNSLFNLFLNKLIVIYTSY